MKKEMRYAAAAAVALVVLFALNVHADNLRNKTGAQLTYALNGVPVYVGCIDNSDAGFTDNSTTSRSPCAAAFTFDNTALIMAQCNNTTSVLARRVNNTDGGTSHGRALRLDTDEKFLLGSLYPSEPYVSVAALDAGVTVCKFFEVK